MALPHLPATYSARKSSALEAAIVRRRDTEDLHRQKWEENAEYFQKTDVKMAKETDWTSEKVFQDRWDAIGVGKVFFFTRKWRRREAWGSIGGACESFESRIAMIKWLGQPCYVTKTNDRGMVHTVLRSSIVSHLLLFRHLKEAREKKCVLFCAALIGRSWTRRTSLRKWHILSLRLNTFSMWAYRWPKATRDKFGLWSMPLPPNFDKYTERTVSCHGGFKLLEYTLMFNSFSFAPFSLKKVKKWGTESVYLII